VRLVVRIERSCLTHFYIVDVFAEQKYQGNQPAVLIPDKELSHKEMQQIAK
jgi:trans-2,3-dihydro-3-hydroxyanthranilate isomerase